MGRLERGEIGTDMVEALNLSFITIVTFELVLSGADSLESAGVSVSPTAGA